MNDFTNLRNADLNTIAELLTKQQARKHDMVVPAETVSSHNATIVVKGAEAVITEDGVTTADGEYLPTHVFDEGISAKLAIPLAYVRRMREERPDLYDMNLNGWLHGSRLRRDAETGEFVQRYGGDDRKFLLRTFKGDNGPGIARAFLSDSYKMMDNLDALMAALEGMRAAGVDVEFAGCDLTERRMTVKVVAPEIKALAPTLLKGYRSPFNGHTGDDNPTVFAGFVLSNSETGGGAFTLLPRLVVQICNNGMTLAVDALRAVHLGGKMDEGVIDWSGDTQQKAADLIRAKTRDAVRTFLDVEYMTKVITRLEDKADKPVEDAVKTITTVSKKLAFTKEEQAGLLDHFIKGGQVTAGGLMQAVTSYAQTVEDADRSYDLEQQGVKVLDLV